MAKHRSTPIATSSLGLLRAPPFAPCSATQFTQCSTQRRLVPAHPCSCLSTSASVQSARRNFTSASPVSRIPTFLPDSHARSARRRHSSAPSLQSPPRRAAQLRNGSLVHFAAARMTLPRSSLVSRSEVRPCHRALARIVQLPVPTIGSGFPPSCASTSRLHPASFSHSRQCLTPLLLPAAAAFSTPVRRSATRARVRSSAISLSCCSLARCPPRFRR